MKKKYIICIFVLLISAALSYKFNANAENVDVPYTVGVTITPDFSNGLQGNLTYKFSTLSTGSDIYNLKVTNYQYLPYTVIQFSRPKWYGDIDRVHYRIKYRINNTSSQNSETIQFGFANNTNNMINPNVLYQYTFTYSLNGYSAFWKSYEDSWVGCIVQGGNQTDANGYGYVILDFYCYGKTSLENEFFCLFGSFNDVQTNLSIDVNSENLSMNDLINIVKSVKNDTSSIVQDIDDANSENVDEIESYDGGANQNIIDGSSILTNNQNDVNTSVNNQIDVIDNAIEQYTIPSLNDDTGILLSVNNFLLGNDFFLTILGTVLLLIVIDIILIKS